MLPFFKLDKADKNDFYQSKYIYFKDFFLGTLIATSVTYFCLLFADLAIIGSFSMDFVLLRSMIVVPLTIIILFYLKTTDFRIMTFISFLMIHAITWGNIWIMSELPDHSFVNENFLMMGLFLLLLSFGMPPTFAIIGQTGLILDLILANHIYNYTNFNVILAYNAQFVILLFFVDLIGTNFYYDHYITSKNLDFALTHDPLTKVFNRRKLDNVMGNSHDLSIVSDQIGLMIMDIDHFKNVNDTYGHDNGDRILQSTASCIKSNLRENDLVIRWGGEEFVVILFDCSEEQISQTAERIRMSIEENDNNICLVTISIGTKIYEGGDCIDEIKLTDQALYAAKANGRNQVVAYEDYLGHINSTTE